MLKRISRLGFFLQFILFLILTSLFWIPEIAHALPAGHSSLEGPLYILLSGWVQPYPVLSSVLALLFVLGMCIILYMITTVNDLVPRENFMPVILLGILLGWNDKLLLLHPILPAGILILLSVQTLMSSYGKLEPYKQIFISSFLISLASLFYIPLAYMMIMVWASFVTYRITTWREWVITFVGFLVPLIYLASWYFVTDRFLSSFSTYDKALADPGLLIEMDGIMIAWLISTLLVLLIATVSVVNTVQDKLISIRKKTFIMVNFIIALGVMLLVSGSSIKESQMLFYIPLAFFMAVGLNMLKKTLFLDLLSVAYLVFLLMLRLFA